MVALLLVEKKQKHSQTKEHTQNELLMNQSQSKFIIKMSNQASVEFLSESSSRDSDKEMPLIAQTSNVLSTDHVINLNNSDFRASDMGKIFKNKNLMTVKALCKVWQFQADDG